MKTDIFISHSAKAERIAREISEALQRRGVSASAAGLNGNAVRDFRSTVKDAMAKAKLIVLVVEPDTEPDQFQSIEWGNAVMASWADSSKRLVPLLIDDADPPGFLRSRGALRVSKLTRDWDAIAGKLIIAMQDRTALGTVSPAKERQERAQRQQRFQEMEEMVKALWPRP